MSDKNQQSDESTGEKQLREALERKDQRIKEMEGRLRLSAFKEAGIDPEEGGMAKAVYRTYEGETDPEAIKAFAQEEYGWEPSAPAPSEAQQRRQAVQEAGKTPEPKGNLEEATEVERNAQDHDDWTRAGYLKDKELQSVAQRAFTY